jgi:DNA-directed RNA polymerase alpha subunit
MSLAMQEINCTEVENIELKNLIKVTVDDVKLTVEYLNKLSPETQNILNGLLFADNSSLKNIEHIFKKFIEWHDLKNKNSK